MKKYYPASLKGKLLGLSVFAVIFFTVYSCRKAETTGAVNNPAAYTIDLNALKESYTTDTLAGKTQSFSTSLNPPTKIITSLNINWALVHYLKRATSRVLEFDMQQDAKPITPVQPVSGQTTRYYSKTSLVFINFDDSTKMRFFMKVTETVSDSSTSVINNVHYNHIPVNFTGRILYYTTAKKLINGYNYVKGKITTGYLPSPATTSGGKTIQSTDKKNLDYYSCTSWYWGNDEDGWEYLGTECYLVVQESGGSEGGAGGDGGGGGGSGCPVDNGGSQGNPTPDPDPGYVDHEPLNVIGGKLTIMDMRNCGGTPTITPAQQALQDSLAQNDAFLINCDSLTLLKIVAYNNYGDMYQQVGKFTPSQAIRDRLDALNNGIISDVFSSFSLQNLDNAFGAIVNSDFYPVNITSLPTGMDMASLTEFYRLNLNTFTSGIATFTPYVDPFVDDTQLFNRPGSQSVGALVHIKMADNGTVVESDYQSNANGTYYKFTTMSSPLDINHPVSGNREFGIYPDPSNPGHYTFYTMGVDRTSDWLFTALNNLGTTIVFNGADKLWSKMQSNLIDYINNHGGHAELYAKPNYIARPDYNIVKDYLNGTITLAQLKQKMGC